MAIRRDPTRTTLLRKRFSREMRVRFGKIKREIRNLIVTLDVFGLNSRLSLFRVNVEREAWRFATDPQKVVNFRSWLQQQIDAEVLSVDVQGQPWTAPYIQSAYRQGTVNAFVDARGAALQEGSDFFAGTREEFLRSAFSQPERASKIALLSTRSFEELRGVTSTMAQQMNRILATGIANGQNPVQIARAMSQNIDGLTRRRAEVIARTEIIYAHAEGQLDSFQELGIEEVGIFAEWSTAGDDRVCPRCGAMEGALLTIDEARGLIPRHPNCRCTWTTADASEIRERRKALIRKINRSIKADAPTKPLRRSKQRSTWAGKEIL